MKQFLKEPLLHFVLLGLSLFLLYGLVSRERDDENTIVIDNYDMDNLIASWEMQWKRLPTDEELKSLVEQNIRQEVFYQEALKMNLDHNDEIIKRRLAQKMQFLSNDLATFNEPTDAELQAYYEANPDKYLTPFVYSFYQVPFSPDYRADPRADAEQLLRIHEGDSRPESLEKMGDPLPFPFRYENTDAVALDRQLGMEFSKAMETTETGKWTGPIRSGFGLHLVYITYTKEPERPPLKSIRKELVRDYEYESQQRVNEQIFRELRNNYTIVFDLDPEKFDQSFVDFLVGSEEKY